MCTIAPRGSAGDVAKIAAAASPARSEPGRTPADGRGGGRPVRRWFRCCGAGLLALAQFLAAPLSRAEDPLQLRADDPQHVRADNAAAEKSQRDAAGLLTIEGSVVDESGAPAAKCRVRLYSSADQVFTSLTDEQGRFRFLHVDLAAASYLTFLADHLKNQTKGCVSILEEGTLALPAPVRIVLRPARELVVEVRDPTEAPIAGALVVISELLHFIEEGRTDEDGTVRFRLPADAEIKTVVALKSGVGFDYWNGFARQRKARPLPDRLPLTLTGARSVRLMAIDTSGDPVPGIDVVPWVVAKLDQEKLDFANMSGFRSQLEGARTDATGTVTIDWLPRRLGKAVTFLAKSDEFHLPNPPSIADPAAEVIELEMKLLRLTSISGAVLTADGQPAVGVLLQAEGRGDTNHYFRGLARTNAEGKFEFRAYPDQSYLVSILDHDWAAPSCTVPQLVEDQPVSGLEFRLSRGTILYGTATTADGRAQSGATVTLVQSAQLPDLAQNLELVRWAKVDSLGRYQFRIGPGTYRLAGPGHVQNFALTIKSQAELVRSFRAN